MLKKIARSLLRQTKMVRGDIHLNDRKGMLHRAWGHVFTNHLNGDYLEFGVYQGNSFIDSYIQYQQFRGWLEREKFSKEQWRREVARNFESASAHFWGFDTFSGIPKNNEKNDTFGEGTFAVEYELVEKKCQKAFSGADDFTLKVGLFSSFKPSIFPIDTKAAIVNIDGDLYESAVDALILARPLLQVGTVLLMDDFNCFCADEDRGERLALSEFLRDTGIRIDKWYPYMFAGQSFLVTKL